MRYRSIRWSSRGVEVLRGPGRAAVRRQRDRRRGQRDRQPHPEDAAIDGPGGAVELRGGRRRARALGSGCRSKPAAAGFAIHADAFYRQHRRSARAALRSSAGGRRQRAQRHGRQLGRATPSGGALGGSMVWDHGYLGVSVDSLPQRLRHRRRGGRDHRHAARHAVAGRRVARARSARSERFERACSRTDYKHEEIEGTARSARHSTIGATRPHRVRACGPGAI